MTGIFKGCVYIVLALRFSVLRAWLSSENMEALSIF